MGQFEQKSVATSKNRTVHLVTTISVAKALCLPMRLAEDFVASLTPIGKLGGQDAYDRLDMEYRARERLGDERDWPTLGRLAVATDIAAKALCCALSAVGILGATNRKTRLPRPSVEALLEHLASIGKIPHGADLACLLVSARAMFARRGIARAELTAQELATCLRLTRPPTVFRGRRSFIVFYDEAKTLDIIFDFFVAKTQQDGSWVSFDHLMETKKVTGKELTEIARRVTKRGVNITHLVSPTQFILIKAAVDSWTAKRSNNGIKTDKT